MSKILKYTYKFADGNSVTLTAKVECTDERRLISEKWLELLEEMDREEKRNDHRETRRHCSLERRDPKGKYLVAKAGGEDELDRLVSWTAFCQMISKKEKYVAEKTFLEGYTSEEIAEMTGIPDWKIRRIIGSLRKVYKNLII